MELSGRKREPKGQALVEFALILLVLLGFIFIIIESGRLFQGWLTVQNSARSAGRYALTGQFDPTCLDTFPPCLDPRVESIKEESRKAAAGLAIFDDVTVGDPNSFITEVWSQDRETGTWRPDDAGEAGEAVRIRVTYRLPIVVPLFEPIVDTVRLRGQVVVNNEDFDQISDNDTYSAAPTIGSGGDYEELPLADVRITKNTINDEFLLGESIDYYIDVYNDGPFDAEGIIVTDDLPNLTGFTYTGYTLAPEDGFCTDPLSWTPGTPVICQLRNLSNDPPLNHVQLILSAQTPYSLSGSDSETLDNIATVESDQSVTIDPDLSNNQALKQVILRKPNADIGISLVDTPDPTLANRPLNYIATITNDGPDPTGTITATINIDSNIDDVSISFTDPNCAKNGSHIVVCTIPLGLAAGGIDQFAIDVTTPSTLVSDPTFLTSIATVESDIIESVDVLPNTDTAITTVAGKLGDVYIEKASEFDRIALEDLSEFRYFIKVGERTGPDLDSASAITVTDQLPTGMTFISDSGSYCNNNANPQTVECAIPPNDIPNDPGWMEFQIIVRPESTGTFDNFVEITSDLEDATPQDNTATAQTIVGANDLAITKSASENIFIGEPFTYTLTVENLGPRDLHGGFVIRDTLPDGVTATDTNGPDGPSNCSPNGGGEESIVAWCLDEIHDEDSPLVFEITALSSVDGEIVNTASVYPSSEDEPDPFLENNEDSLTSLVQRKVDLVLDLSEVVDPVTAGGQVSYNLQVWNLGPSFATEVTIVDNLPSVLTFDPTNSSAGCSAVGQSVTCSLDLLPVGITETMTIVADIDSALEGGDTFQNTAVVSSFEVELVPENNSDTEYTSVSRAVDLQITKSDSPDPVAAGAVLEYTLEVENNGPSDASNVTVTDELPSVLRFDPINSSDNCQAVGQLVTCNGLNLATNEIQSFNVSAIVTSTLPAGTSIQNTAIVTSTEQENNPGDNSASATTLVAREVDVQILKLDDPDPVVAGTVLTYTFRVRNNGPSDAFGVRFVDELPKWMTINSINAPDTVTCTSKKTNVLTLECDIGDMSAAEVVIVNVQFQIPPDRQHNSTLLNTAEVFIDGPDENPANNISPEQVTTIVRDADLRIQKNASTNEVLAGQSLEFSINVWNDGPSYADGVVINDILADGLIFAGSPDGCSADGQSVSCPIGTMAVGASDLARFSVDVDSALPPSTITNTATITSTIDPDSNLLNNTSNEVQISTDVEADLSITKDDGVSTIVAGESTIFTYQIEVSNNGPSDAKSVVVTDTWPSEYTLDQITTSSGFCVVGDPGFICTPDDIKPGDSVVIIADYTVPANIPASSITNQVEASSATPDPSSPNIATDTNNVVIEADLSITKNDGESIVVAGDNQTYQYTMVIGNVGPSDAIGVEVADTWPSGFSRGAINAPAGVTCNDDGAGFTCSNINLLVGESMTIIVDYSVPPSTPPGNQINSAQVTLVGNNDPDNSNNQDTDTTTVETWVDLSITKDDGISTPITAGENVILTFTFSATNNGTSDANEVVVTDVWPANYEIVSKPGFCTDPDTNDEITCTLGSLATGAGPTTFTIDYRVFPGATLGTTTNSVSISSNDTMELNGDDNSDTDANVVIASSDLRVSKIDNVLVSVAAGDQVTYTYDIIVTNFGPSDADAFSITDDWPAEFIQGSVVSSIGTCDASGGDFRCDFSGLPSGSAAIVNAEFSVPANTALGVYTNTATILDATTSDPDTSNDSDSETTEVVVSADLSISKEDGLSSPIQAGDNVTYTYSIVVTNEGPSDANAFSVSDVWPAEFNQGVVSSSSGSCSANGGDFNCDFNGLLPGETATITAEFSVPAGTAADVYSNMASIVNATTPDPDPSNDSETEPTTVVASADLAISKDDGVTSPIDAGDGNTYTYEIAVTNNGPSNAGPFSVDDTWPIEFSQGTVTSSAGTCTVNDGDFGCDFGGLLPGETVTITAEYSVPAVTAPNTYTNTVAINNAITPDPNASNNSVTVGTRVEVSADLEITKGDNVIASVTAGDGITYTYNIEITNNGPSVAGAFTVSDVWPTEFSQGSVTSADGICDTNGGNFSCNFNGLQPNESVSISAEFSVPSNVSPGVYSNTASISTASTPDPLGTNDDATAVTTVIDSVDISIYKSDGVSTVMTGTNAIYTYTITASNVGPSDAENVTIEEAWPADLVRKSISSTDGLCTPIIDNFNCNFGTVTAGSFITISIAYSVSNSIAVSEVTNIVTVTTTSNDSNIGNNDSEDTNTIDNLVGAADSAIDKYLVADLVDWTVPVGLTGLNIQNKGPL